MHRMEMKEKCSHLNRFSEILCQSEIDALLKSFKKLQTSLTVEYLARLGMKGFILTVLQLRSLNFICSRYSVDL